MGPDGRTTLAVLEEAHRMFVENVRGISLEEALSAAGGHRSILGIAKHVAGWSAVYHSYAFESQRRHWAETDWPRGLRDRIEPSEPYLREVTAPLRDIAIMVAAHWLYHAGEINAIPAIRRGEAWEYLEEVEENHIPTLGHRVRPDWMTDAEAARYEDEHGEGTVPA